VPPPREAAPPSPPLEAQRPFITAQTLRASTRALSSAIRTVAAIRLAGGAPAPPALAAMAFSGDPPPEPEEAWRAFEEQFPGSVGTTAPPAWNAWINPGVTWSRHSDPLVGSRGRLVNLFMGADRRVLDRGVAGLILSHERASHRTPATQGRLDGEGFGIGAYGGYALSDVIVADGLVLWASSDNDLSDPFSSGSYTSRRWTAAGNLTAYHYADGWRMSPTLGLSWSREREAGFVSSLGVPSPGRTTGTVTASTGAQIGRGVDLDGGGSIEPWIGVTASWDVSTTRSPPPEPGSRSLGRFDLTASAGMNLQVSERASLTLKGDFSGLARSGLRQTTAGAQLSVQF
jgi:outer membrane autotransporter protein